MLLRTKALLICMTVVSVAMVGFAYKAGMRGPTLLVAGGLSGLLVYIVAKTLRIGR